MKRTLSAAEQLDAVGRAQELAQSGTVNSLLDQADALLDRAVSAHRAGKLTDRDAAVALAVISELWAAAGKATRAITKGAEAAQSITTT